jgi:serine/threonine protein kinase
MSNSGSVARVSHPGSNTLGELKLLQLVGQGTFGQVYKALWRRRCVAVKVLQLPATAGGSDVTPWAGVARVSSHREKMAVMETVVSTTMSHPNIVQVRAAALLCMALCCCGCY